MVFPPAPTLIHTTIAVGLLRQPVDQATVGAGAAVRSDLFEVALGMVGAIRVYLQQRQSVRKDISRIIYVIAHVHPRFVMFCRRGDGVNA